MTEPYEQTQPTDDGGVIVPPARDWPPRALDADGDGQPDYREPTQVRYPWRATVRTIIAVVLALGLVVPAAWAILGDELVRAGLVLPEPVVQVVGWLLAVLAVVTGTITRIMAIPQVADWMTRLNIGPKPKED